MTTIASIHAREILDSRVTNPAIIRRAVAEHVGNAALIKLNQIGTLTETLEAIAVARDGHDGIVVSHHRGSLGRHVRRLHR